MASGAGNKGVERVLTKLESAMDQGNYYEGKIDWNQ